MANEHDFSNQPPTLSPAGAQGPQGAYAGWAPPGVGWQYPGAGPWQAAPQRAPRPVRRSSFWRVVFWLFLLGVLGFSILLNIVLLGEAEGLGAQGGGLVQRQIQGGDDAQTVAVYSIVGVIDGEAVSQFSQFHDAVAYNRDVQAVVLRVESPGGSVTASDQIHKMVKEIKSSGKRVVVSMGSVAASGGYYISAPADEIFAEETSITGSIGVITAWVVFKGTLEKIGAEMLTIKSTNAEIWKDAMSPTATPQEYQIDHIRDILDQMQARFEKVVKDGRNKKLNPQTETVQATDDEGNKVEKKCTAPFNGKIYLADEAKKLGLIDDIGYEDDAIERAQKLARLDNAKVVRYVRRRTFMETLFDGEARTAPVKIDANLIDKLQTPRFMMLWKVD